MRFAQACADLDCLHERVCRLVGIAGTLTDLGQECDSRTKDPHQICLGKQLANLFANRIGALALWAGESAHQVDDGRAIRICAGRQPATCICRREVPRIDLLGSQQAHQ
jgi:hypothetical protein